MFLQWLPGDVDVVDQDEGTYSRRDANFILITLFYIILPAFWFDLFYIVLGNK